MQAWTFTAVAAVEVTATIDGDTFTVGTVDAGNDLGAFIDQFLADATYDGPRTVAVHCTPVD